MCHIFARLLFLLLAEELVHVAFLDGKCPLGEYLFLESFDDRDKVFVCFRVLLCQFVKHGKCVTL